MSRPIPQTSFGRLVSLSVDNPKYYTQGPPSSPPPPLIPISSASTVAATNDDSEEKTMLWRNIATLFAKYDNIESDLEKHRVDTVRCTDEVYQELQDVKGEIAQVQPGVVSENDMFTKHVRKLRKYVNKKCEGVRESVSYSSCDADNEIFAYIDKTRVEADTKTKSMQEEITRLNSAIRDFCDALAAGLTDPKIYNLRALCYRCIKKYKLAEIDLTHAMQPDVVSENNVFTKHVQKLRKYVNKKCEGVCESASYSSYDADNEIFAYIDKNRVEADTKTKSMQEEITRLNSEMEELNETYNRDYDVFIQREDDMMAKLDAAVKMNEDINNRMKDMEEIFMRQIKQARNYADTQVAGDLREEFSTAICRELALESTVSAQLVQSVNDELTGVITRSNEATNQRIKYLEDFLMNKIQQARNYAATEVAECLREEFCREVAESNVNAQQLVQGVHVELTDLITQSNEYHSARYFGTVEDVKLLRETCQTLKQSIGMVDAELSDTKETVEYLKDEVGQTVTDLSEIAEHVTELKDDVYRELDRDYYDLKDYVKHKVTQHKKQHHKPQVSQVQVRDISSLSEDPIQMIVDEYADTTVTTATVTATATATLPDLVEEQLENDENVIIIDANTFISDDEDIEHQHT